MDVGGSCMKKLNGKKYGTWRSMEALAHNIPPPRLHRSLSETSCPPTHFVLAVSFNSTLTSSMPSLTVVAQPSSANPFIAWLNPLEMHQKTPVVTISSYGRWLVIIPLCWSTYLSDILWWNSEKQLARKLLSLGPLCPTFAHLASRWLRPRRTAGCWPPLWPTSPLDSCASLRKNLKAWIIHIRGKYKSRQFCCGYPHAEFFNNVFSCRFKRWVHTNLQEKTYRNCCLLCKNCRRFV